MKNRFRELSNIELAIKWWKFRRLRPSEGERGHLTIIDREHLLDIAIDRLSHAQHDIDRLRMDRNVREHGDDSVAHLEWLARFKDLLDEYEDVLIGATS